MIKHKFNERVVGYMTLIDFNATLTGSDGLVSGVVKQMANGVYRFVSLDDTLHITIALDAEGNWKRIDGTEPYFSGWADELAEQVNKQKH